MIKNLIFLVTKKILDLEKNKNYRTQTILLFYEKMSCSNARPFLWETKQILTDSHCREKKIWTSFSYDIFSSSRLQAYNALNMRSALQPITNVPLQ